MDINSVANMSRVELMNCINEKKKEIAEKVKNGDTEPSFAIGAESYTVKEWDRLMQKIDKNIEAVRKEQEERREKLEKEREQDMLVRSAFDGSSSVKCNYVMAKMNGTYKPSFPYEGMAKDGVIAYNGVVFVGDAEKNALCLGDMSDKRNVLTIPLEGGGNLMVNRDNFGDLADAISMFSPEDRNRIMRAIANDKKAQEAQNTIEEETNSIGDDAEENVLDGEAAPELMDINGNSAENNNMEDTGNTDTDADVDTEMTMIERLTADPDRHRKP